MSGQWDEQSADGRAGERTNSQADRLLSADIVYCKLTSPCFRRPLVGQVDILQVLVS